MKLKVLRAVLAAIGLCLAAEALCRYFPSLLPHNFNIFRVKYSLMGRYTMEDADFDHILPADFHQVFQWRGRRLEIRHAPIPGQSRVGYRADSRTLGQPHADIVALGDSFTNAVEVDQDSTWPSRLGAITGLRVANLGVPGFATTQQAEFFHRYGSSLRPKLVILLLGSNDPSRNMFFRYWRLLKSREDPSHPVPRFATYMFCRSTGLSGGVCRA
ncbi:MAG: GDSL-type esterase/lipase family protein, partial [candidate division NC10 bacterium]